MTSHEARPGHLATQFADLISSVFDAAPEGYEADYIKARLLISAIDNGADPYAAMPIPKTWRARFIALSLHTELPASLCARLSGVTLAYIRFHLGRRADSELATVLQIGRAANFESRIDHPTPRDLRSPTIPLAGLNALSAWEGGTADHASVADDEIDRVIELKKRFNLQLEAEDLQEAEGFEAARAESPNTMGVLGLNSLPDGFVED